MGPDVRRNLQVRQPTNQGDDVNDQNGWPTPLTDPSNELRVAVTLGNSGESSNIEALSTSTQDQLSLAEGQRNPGPGDMTNQGGNGNKLKTTQQNAGEHHTSEG